MKDKAPSWQKRFELTTCSVMSLESAIPAEALGVAVIYGDSESGETIFLVLESRAQSLRSQCLKRLQTAKLPDAGTLQVAFKATALPDASAEAVHEACRQQVILGGELRRELRPAMR